MAILHSRYKKYINCEEVRTRRFRIFMYATASRYAAPVIQIHIPVWDAMPQAVVDA